ncbi:MAG: hypothetical protein HOV80_21950 [Polyangiaceae bacterium]|nr:hypothetical protein [Polyangiaceae bacterium]
MSDETEEKEAEQEKDSDEEKSDEAESADAKSAEKKDDKKDEEPAEDEAPLFARTYPKTPEVEALLAAFERGNYARVREEAPALASRSSDPEVKRAAEDLLRRIQPDPVSKTLLAVAALLLLFFVYWYFGHQHEGPK